MAVVRQVVRPRVVQRGFTLVELVATMIIIGILAVVALPRMGAKNGLREAVFRDQIAAALRHAQKTAVSRRRLVCANINAESVTLTVAAMHPAATCNTPLHGPDGGPYAVGNGAKVAGGTGIIHFHPSGSATNAGGTTTNFSIAVGMAGSVSVTGATGHVR